MVIRKKIKAALLKAVLKLPEEIKDDTLLYLTIEDGEPSEKDQTGCEHRRGFNEIRTLFQSRIRAAGIEENFAEEVFSMEEITWQDLNEIKSSFEEEGYGVTINQQDKFVRIKILWRYA